MSRETGILFSGTKEATRVFAPSASHVWGQRANGAGASGEKTGRLMFALFVEALGWVHGSLWLLATAAHWVALGMQWAGLFQPRRGCRIPWRINVMCKDEPLSWTVFFMRVAASPYFGRLILVGVFSQPAYQLVIDVLRRKGRVFNMAWAVALWVWVVALRKFGLTEAASALEAVVLVLQYHFLPSRFAVGVVRAALFDMAAVGWFLSSWSGVWSAAVFLSHVLVWAAEEVPFQLRDGSEEVEVVLPDDDFIKILGDWVPSSDAIAKARQVMSVRTTDVEWPRVRAAALVGDRMLKVILAKLVEGRGGNVADAASLEQQLESNRALTVFVREACPRWYSEMPDSMRGEAAATVAEAVWGVAYASFLSVRPDDYDETFAPFFERVAAVNGYDLRGVELVLRAGETKV